MSRNLCAVSQRIARPIGASVWAFLATAALGCVVTIPTNDLPQVESQRGDGLLTDVLVEDVLVEISLQSDLRQFGNLDQGEKDLWTNQVVRGFRDSRRFRAVRTRSEPGRLSDSFWRAEVFVVRYREDRFLLYGLWLISAALIPNFVDTTMAVRVTLTSPDGETGEPVTVRSSFRSFISWLLIPIGIASQPLTVREQALIYGLTQAALAQIEHDVRGP